MPHDSGLASQQSYDEATHVKEIALLYQQSRRVEVDNAVLKLLNEILQKTSKGIETFKGGGWDIVSHEITRIERHLVVSFLLRR